MRTHIRTISVFVKKMSRAAPEAQIACLEAVLEDGDPKVIASALGAIAPSGMPKVACEAGVTRPALCKALSEEAIRA